MRGVSLEQFKHELDSDAQKRCLAQEKTIKELHEELKNKDILIKQLQNRCFLISYGIFCSFCGCKDNCNKGGKHK